MKKDRHFLGTVNNMEERDFFTDAGDKDIPAVVTDHYIIGYDHIPSLEFSEICNELVEFLELPDHEYTYESVVWEFLDDFDKENNKITFGSETAVSFVERF